MGDYNEGGSRTELATFTCAPCHLAKFTLLLFIRVRLGWEQVHQMRWPKRRLSAVTI